MWYSMVEQDKIAAKRRLSNQAHLNYEVRFLRKSIIIMPVK